MSIPGDSPWSSRFSAFHDIARWPGMVLPASYDAMHYRILVEGKLPENPGGAVEFLNGFQAQNGAFRLPGMTEDSTYKGPDPARTREYIDFHATNYAFGAIRSLGGRESCRFAFLDAYLTKDGLQAWMDARQWDDPWMEGNLVVNLGSFLIAMAEDGDIEAAARLAELMDWLDRIQDPSTGFWGTRFSGRRALLEAMAGAMHIYHLYYYLDRAIPNLDRIATHCVSLANDELSALASACLDVDIVDVIANLHRLGVRRAEMEGIIERKLSQLLDAQNDDGGFFDERSGILRFDGWVGGYWEPQGISNCFATWFRMLTVGIGSCVLFPGSAGSWRFRNTVGIGYWKNNWKV
jgi:hypothetical protein